MRFRRIASDVVEVVVDEDSGSVVSIKNLVTGREHLFARKPELLLKRVGMGIVELEPVQCYEWSVDEGGRLRCSVDGLVVVKSVVVDGPWVLYRVVVRNESSDRREVRIRTAIYSACGRGGFWGDPGVEGATYSCRYYVDFGPAETWGTFSTIRNPGTVRGYRFEKHSYKSMFFPELRWIALVDRVLGEGMAIVCRTPGCYGVVENQFFNLEIDIVTPATILRKGEEISLEFAIVLFHGLERVDTVDRDAVIGLEVPSVVLPGEKVRGRIAIYPLTEAEAVVEGELVLRRGMGIGKRGYCVDRVVDNIRTMKLSFNPKNVVLKKYTPVYIEMVSEEAVQWSFERELYEIPYIVARLLGKEVKRAISINPDVALALKSLEKKGKLYSRAVKYLLENPSIESEYMEREASSHIYTLSSKYRFNPVKIVGILKNIDGDSLELVKKYLERRYVRERASQLSGVDLLNMSPLDLALAYFVEGSKEYLNKLSQFFKIFSSLVEREDYVTYYRAIHGGAGADRFAEYVLALDMVEDLIDRDVVEDAYISLRWISEEISKLTNAWTGNWELSEALGLIAIAGKLRYPGFEEDIEKALNVARISLSSFLRDGAWPELSTSYHMVSLAHLIRIAEVCRMLGLEDLYSYRVGDRSVIENALNWLWNILTPVDRTPAMEDAGSDIPSPDLFFIPAVRYQNKKLMYVAYRLSKRVPIPNWPFTALLIVKDGLKLEQGEEWIRDSVTVFYDSGRFVYRESEDPNALYFVLDFGPQGGWHGHPDRLNFELHYRGEPIIVDAGSGGYYNPIHWVWSRRSIAHNTITLGESDHEEYTRGEVESLEVTSDRVYAVFSSNISKDVKVRREVTILPKSRTVEIVDTVFGSGLFRWNIHCRGVHKQLDRWIHRFHLNGVVYTIELPHDVDVVVSKGYRGSSEETVYIYYEKRIDGVGRLGAKIVLEDRVTYQ